MVVTVTWAVAAPDPSSVTDAGLDVHVASDGTPLQATVTGPFKPPPGAKLRL